MGIEEGNRGGYLTDAERMNLLKKPNYRVYTLDMETAAIDSELLLSLDVESIYIDRIDFAGTTAPTVKFHNKETNDAIPLRAGMTIRGAIATMFFSWNAAGAGSGAEMVLVVTSSAKYLDIQI